MLTGMFLQFFFFGRGRGDYVWPKGVLSFHLDMLYLLVCNGPEDIQAVLLTVILEEDIYEHLNILANIFHFPIFSS